MDGLILFAVLIIVAIVLVSAVKSTGRNSTMKEESNNLGKGYMPYNLAYEENTTDDDYSDSDCDSGGDCGCESCDCEND